LIVALLASAGVCAQAQLANPGENLPALEPATGSPTETQATPNTREPTISFGVFSEPIELTTLIDYVGKSLNVNIVVKGAPTGEIVFNAPVSVPRSKLIGLLDAMLEQYAFTISYDPDSKFYIVQPITDVKPVFGDKLATTRIIPTPNIKPSLIVPALKATLGTPASANASSSDPIQAVDELGVLIINAPPRDIRRIEQMVEELLRLDNDQQYIRFELNHLAAPTALDRAIGLVGGSRSQTIQPRNNPNNPQGGIQQGVSISGGSLSNIGERITIDPQGNALIFKGTPNEIERVREVLDVIDVPNTLEPKNYFAGSSAAQIADIAKRRGLGEVIEIEAAQQQNPFNFGNQGQQFNQQSNDVGQGGPVMVVDPEHGNIIYYGTNDQHEQLSALLNELKTEDERVVIRNYILNHSDAQEMADLLNAIITGESQTGQSDLLPGNSGRNNRSAFINGFPINNAGGDGDSIGGFDPDKITITAATNSNQIVVNAPIRQQDDLMQLIERLDRRRSQVYIKAMIVSIADNEDYTLAFETQLNAGQYSMGTNFGLSTPATGASFTDPKSVATGLGGLTQAIIKSEYVPLIINATQTNTNIRILSTPQLLVNDNVESTIVSVSEQPFTQDTPSNGGIATSFGGFEEAGTTLTVTPSISEGGFIRLAYHVELSNFTSATGTAGSPPPRDRNTVDGSATVPSNATIVIGGITVEDVRDTVIKVPFLGDIPIAGELFKRTGKVNNKSKLYIFLTPQIMNDPNFNDLKLFSKGPQSEMDIENGPPALEPAIILAPNTTESLPSFDGPIGMRSAPPLEPAHIEVSEVTPKGTDER